MKTYRLFSTSFLLLVFGLLSCKNTLDTHPTQSFDETTVWGTKATVEGFINDTYTDVLQSGYVGSGTCVGWESRTPNAVLCTLADSSSDGVVNELGLSKTNDWGTNRFGLLRRTNMILTKVQENTSLSDAEKKELMAHGYLMRGMIFFDQTRKMGRFVPVTQVFTTEKPEEVRIPMTKDVGESYKYVISDLKHATEGLPPSAPAGLPTKWAAGVLLSRVALQAYAYTGEASYIDLAIEAAEEVIKGSGISLSTSSGLFNEMDDRNPEILWGYYREKKNSTIGGFSELIRTYPNLSADDIATSKSPVPLKHAKGRTFEGWAIHFPSQDLVDNFLVTDEATGEALPWWKTSQYLSAVDVLDPSLVTKPGQVDSYKRTNGDDRRIPTAQDFLQTNAAYPTFLRYHKLKAGAKADISDLMYKNRDRRFYTAVVYDKCTWIGEDVELNLGGNLSQGVRDREDGGWYNTATGYYWRKSSIENPEPRAYYNCQVALHYNIVRLAEAYLNLAEAYLLKGNVAKAVEALNHTRTVHGGIAPSKASTPEEAWKDYIRERTCELTNEGGDLYFSYLRWGKYGGYANAGREPGDVIAALDKPVYKIEISRDRSQLLIGQVTLQNCAQRSFTTRRYLLPINQGFLDVREAYDLDHTQNPGW